MRRGDPFSWDRPVDVRRPQNPAGPDIGGDRRAVAAAIPAGWLGRRETSDPTGWQLCVSCRQGGRGIFSDHINTER